jgi:hypothetical protein
MSKVIDVGEYTVLYHADSKRQYYYHSLTNATTWDMPQPVAAFISDSIQNKRYYTEGIPFPNGSSGLAQCGTCQQVSFTNIVPTADGTSHYCGRCAALVSIAATPPPAGPTAPGGPPQPTGAIDPAEAERVRKEVAERKAKAQAAEAERKKKVAEDEKKRKQAEDDLKSQYEKREKKKSDEERKKKEDEDARVRYAAEASAKAKADEEERVRKANEDAKTAAEEAERARVEAIRKAEEEEAARKKEAEIKKRYDEEEAKKKKKADEIKAKRDAEEAAAAKRRQEQDEMLRKLERRKDKADPGAPDTAAPAPAAVYAPPPPIVQAPVASTPGFPPPPASGSTSAFPGPPPPASTSAPRDKKARDKKDNSLDSVLSDVKLTYLLSAFEREGMSVFALAAALDDEKGLDEALIECGVPSDQCAAVRARLKGNGTASALQPETASLLGRAALDGVSGKFLDFGLTTIQQLKSLTREEIRAVGVSATGAVRLKAELKKI